MLTIYGVPISVHVRKTVVTALLKGIEHKVEPVIPFNPPPNWSTLSPTGLIPAMQDGDFTLAETGAICFYMERKTPTPAIFPEDTNACSKALFYDGYSGYLFRNLVHGLFFELVINPKILKRTTDQSVVDKIMGDTQPKLFQYLESQVNGPFLVGDTLSFADLGIVSSLINYQYLGFAIDKAKYPKVARYVSDMIRLKPFERALV